MTDAEMWFRIAELLQGGRTFICNIANDLERWDKITPAQNQRVRLAIREELKRQNLEADDVLWDNISAYSEQARALRVRFCAQQLRKLAR